jgi:hypothetical protein
MKLSDLTSAQLAELSRLIAQKEKLAAQLAAIDAKIEGLGGEKIRGAKTAATGKAKGRRGPRKGSKPGRLKEAVLAALHSSGAGLTIKELSSKLKVKPNNLYSWFYTTGRKVTGLKKAGDKYSYAK